MRSTVLLILLLGPSLLSGQTIRGVVLEEGTSYQVAGATIQLLAADSTLIGSVQTDAKGWFHLEAGAAGTFLLRPSHPSYAPLGTHTVTVGSHEIVTLVLKMDRAVIPLEPLVVTARSRDRLAGFYDRAGQKGLGKYVHREFIDARITALPSELLRMTPGVRLERSNSAIPTNVITLPAPTGRCIPDVFLDGLPVPSDTVFSIDDFTAAELIEGIEIYDGYAVPPDIFHLRSDPQCGVVAYWTRRNVRRAFSWRNFAIFLAGAGILFLLTRPE